MIAAIFNLRLFSAACSGVSRPARPAVVAPAMVLVRKSRREKVIFCPLRLLSSNARFGGFGFGTATTGQCLVTFLTWPANPGPENE